jgi:hypothetical protein
MRRSELAAAGDGYHLGVTTVGNHAPTLSHLTIQDIDNYQMDLVVRDVYRRLNKDSAIFSDTLRVQQHRLPHFLQEGKPVFLDGAGEDV